MITTTGQLEAVRPEWNMLWSRATAATPFQSPDWLITWWNYLGSGRLAVLALRHNGRLVGLVPWLARDGSSESKRTLFFLADGVSDYLDALFEEGFERAGIERAMEWLQSSDGGWQGCDLRELPASSPLISVRSPSAWHSGIIHQNVCPVLRLPRRPAEIGFFVPRGQLEKLSYYRGRARRLCDLNVECATETTFPQLFPVFLRLHQARWAARGQRGVLADRAVERFHFDVAGAFIKAKILRLYVLRLKDTMAAALYLFMHRKRAYFYLAGFDPEFKVFSPGMLLIGHAIDQAIVENAAEFDFLRGSESYKYRWGAVDRTTFRRTFFRRPQEGELNRAQSA